MDISADTPRKQRVIGQSANAEKGLAEVKFEVMVPTPYSPGYVVDEAHASILNQTLAENVSNNLRAKLIRGFELSAPAEGKEGTYRPYTAEEAQALVDEYVAGYTPGVRTGGGGAPRITDPVEKEALGLAGTQVEAFLSQQGVAKKDVKFAEMRAALFAANRDNFMKEAKRIVDARNKAVGNSGDLTASLLALMPGVAPEAEAAE